jgi:hypothetical protein
MAEPSPVFPGVDPAPGLAAWGAATRAEFDAEQEARWDHMTIPECKRELETLYRTDQPFSTVRDEIGRLEQYIPRREAEEERARRNSIKVAHLRSKHHVGLTLGGRRLTESQVENLGAFFISEGRPIVEALIGERELADDEIEALRNLYLAVTADERRTS